MIPYLTNDEIERLKKLGLISFPEPGGRPALPLPGKLGVPRRTIGALGRAGDPLKTVAEANAAVTAAVPVAVRQYEALEDLVRQKLEGYVRELEEDREKFLAEFAPGTTPLGIRTGYDRAINVLRTKLP